MEGPFTMPGAFFACRRPILRPGGSLRVPPAWRCACAGTNGNLVPGRRIERRQTPDAERETGKSSRRPDEMVFDSMLPA